MIVSTGVVSTTAVAQAVAGYHTSGTNVRVRAGANTQTAQINSIASAGTPLDMECQTAGQTVTASGFGTSSVWDKLYGYGGYISDLFVRETPTRNSTRGFLVAERQPPNRRPPPTERL